MIIHIYIHIIVYNNLLVIPNPKSEAPNPAPFPCKPLCPAVPKMTQGIFTSLTSVSSNSDGFLQKSGGNSNEKPCNPGLMA